MGKKKQAEMDAQWAKFSAGMAENGRDHIFDSLVYQRGALTLHALRKKIGDKRFFGLARSWATHNKGKTVTTRQFQAFAEKYSGHQLDGFFRTWVYTAGKPDIGS